MSARSCAVPTLTGIEVPGAIACGLARKVCRRGTFQLPESFCNAAE